MSLPTLKILIEEVPKFYTSGMTTDLMVIIVCRPGDSWKAELLRDNILGDGTWEPPA